jgi:hypothetical protein
MYVFYVHYNHLFFVTWIKLVLIIEARKMWTHFFFGPMIPDIGNSIALFEGSQASPACPSGNSSIKRQMIMEHWWNDTDSTRSTFPAPLCPPEVLHGLARYGTEASVVRGRRLIVWPWQGIETWNSCKYYFKLQYLSHRKRSVSISQDVFHSVIGKQSLFILTHTGNAGPALGRLDRFDAIGPRALGGNYINNSSTAWLKANKNDKNGPF